nr:substrate-binding domain-containing protein [Streptomyces sp. NBC_00886]
MSEDSAPRSSRFSRRGLLAAAGAIGAVSAVAACDDSKATADTSASGGSGGVYYWLSHGTPGDPIWVIANNGATQAGKDLKADVRTSFFSNDVAKQKEAFTSAIAAKPAGIATSAPQPKVLDDLIAQATKAGIPVITFNSDTPTSKRLAYVGADLQLAGVTWANYLVDNNLVKAGDKVWLPVEAAGATYQVLETTGIKSVFSKHSITVDVFQAGSDPAQSLSAMQDYLTAHKSSVAAVIGLGDLVMGNIQKAFTAAGIAPGKTPVVGWGNTKDTATAVKAGYVQAALWQYPDSQGYLPIALLKMLKDGLGAGYDIATTALYTKDNVDDYARFLK